MNEKLKKLEIKKLLQEYDFLLSDNDYKMELIETEKINFSNSIKEICEKKGIKQKEEDNTIKESIDEGISIDLEIKKDENETKIKKLFREIVKVTHPDKINSQEFIDVYHKSVEAVKSNDIVFLYKVCIDLKIDFNIDELDIEIFKKSIEEKRKKIKKIESSFIWLWINSKTEKEKMNLVELYVSELLE